MNSATAATELVPCLAIACLFARSARPPQSNDHAKRGGKHAQHGEAARARRQATLNQGIVANVELDVEGQKAAEART